MQARSSQQRYAERHRDTAAALSEAEERAEASQELVKHLRGLVEDKESRVSDLERQLRAASSVRSPTWIIFLEGSLKRILAT
jgi:hypothetical protein